MMMNLIALPAFDDNYIWMLHDGRDALVVDPGAAQPVHAALDARDLRLAGILVTHHHADHVGGLPGLRERLEGPVYAPATEAIAGELLPLRGGESARLLGLDFDVIDVPGHTAGHIAYHLAAPAVDIRLESARDAGDERGHDHGDRAPLLFCGDTLFSAGCGRLFEGTPAQMHASLQSLAALPGATRVCCAHEYTLSNLRFAQAVEPDNPRIDAYRAWCEATRSRGQPTLPSTIARERDVNPFLRVQEPSVVRCAMSQGADDDSPVAVFAALRNWKNTYR